MATKRSEAPLAEPAGRDLSDVISQNVLHTLGRPDDLQRVQVRQLWERHYRVNIFTGGDATSVRVANSFFLIVDAAGVIVSSVPTIARQY